MYRDWSEITFVQCMKLKSPLRHFLWVFFLRRGSYVILGWIGSLSVTLPFTGVHVPMWPNFSQLPIYCKITQIPQMTQSDQMTWLPQMNQSIPATQLSQITRSPLMTQSAIMTSLLQINYAILFQ